MDSVEKSIERAQKLLKTKGSSENYISIKIKPANGGCCCFHCWPRTWEKINSEISFYGYLEDEGDVVIGDISEEFVLECHESGPEIIVYLPIAIAGANLILNITNLILSIIKNRQHENRGAQFKITKRVIKKSKIIEEDIMEIDFPLSTQNIALLNDKVKAILQRGNN